MSKILKEVSEKVYKLESRVTEYQEKANYWKGKHDALLKKYELLERTIDNKDIGINAEEFNHLRHENNKLLNEINILRRVEKDAKKFYAIEKIVKGTVTKKQMDNILKK